MAKAATHVRSPKKPEAPKPPTAEEIAELGLTLEEDGKCAVRMLTGASGEGFSLEANETHRCDAATAVSWVRRHIAEPRRPKQ